MSGGGPVLPTEETLKEFLHPLISFCLIFGDGVQKLLHYIKTGVSEMMCREKWNTVKKQESKQ